MSSIFNALNVGYSGLNVAQNGISTTGHNIANAETEGYTRQRVVASAATPLSLAPGNVGNGATIMDIKRVFDNFVFDKFTAVSSDKEYSDFEKKTLEELSTYFPEIDGVGVKADLAEYYNMWEALADNPENDSVKLALATQTNTLTKHISATQNQVKGLQSRLNDQLEVNINEVNSVAKELSQLNKSIDHAEAGKNFSANDLRDKRNVLERTLSRLIGAVSSSGRVESNMQIDSSSNTKTGSYTVHVNGFNIVDGGSYHPIHLENKDNKEGFYEISFERQDGTLIPMAEKINGGVVGSILALRGASLDSTSGMPSDGIIQNVVSQLDAFTAAMIESTNNVYANSSTDKMTSNVLSMDPDDSVVSSSYNIHEGSFNLVVYDIDGNIAAKRSIEIDEGTTMRGSAGTNSIQAKMKAEIDDNEDGNANNDVDDYVDFHWATYAGGENALEFSLDAMKQSKGYTFALEDNLKSDFYSSGTNFAGALGMNRYLDGNDAQSMSLTSELKHDPSLIASGVTPLAGDNILALNMVQHQYERFDFVIGDGKTHNETSYSMFDIIATDVGTKTNAAVLRNETVSTQYNAIELEYSSVSKVSIDEEMTNLIKYQTSYGAAAKVITTIDQMMQTLLGIKT